MKLIRICFLLVCIGLMSTACHRKIAPEIPAQVAPVEEAKPTELVVIDRPPEIPRQPYVLVYERSACFGNCPVYTVQVYVDGTVSWNGKAHTTRKGAYNAFAGIEWAKALQEQAEKIGFFQMAPQYPLGAKLQDVPSTTLRIARAGQLYTVIDNGDAPLALQQFEKELDAKLDSLNWQ